MEVQVDMKKVNPGKDEQLKTCWGTMLKYIGNIAKVCLSCSLNACVGSCHRLHAVPDKETSSSHTPCFHSWTL